MKKYICNCNREFNKQTSLSSHARFCDKYKKKPKQKSKYKINDNLYKCECNREFNNHQSLNSHFSHCIIHRSGVPPKKINTPGKMLGWDKFSKERIEEISKKSGNTLSTKIASGEIIPYWKGKKHSKKSKRKFRKSAIKYIQESKGKCSPRYNRTACVYFDELSIKNNWNLTHAENGG